MPHMCQVYNRHLVNVLSLFFSSSYHCSLKFKGNLAFHFYQILLKSELNFENIRINITVKEKKDYVT